MWTFEIKYQKIYVFIMSHMSCHIYCVSNINCTVCKYSLTYDQWLRDHSSLWWISPGVLITQLQRSNGWPPLQSYDCMLGLHLQSFAASCGRVTRFHNVFANNQHLLLVFRKSCHSKQLVCLMTYSLNDCCKSCQIRLVTWVTCFKTIMTLMDKFHYCC